ncbi:MAG: hypothetical protein GXP55_01325 [Deltaproteobacteria bacterium]|nr:hypothetical protein [Deltaproteobacteria bacterium]
MMRVISFFAAACALLASCTSGSVPHARPATPDAAVAVATSLELRGWVEPVIVEQRGFGVGVTTTGALAEARIGWGRALGTAAVTSAPVREGGVVVRDVGWALARLDGTRDRIEQSWVVASRPATPALDIRVDIEGGVFLGSGSDGLVFRTIDQSYLLYGHGVWVDADGRRTRVAAHHVDGGVALLVPKELLDRSTYPATLDPIIGTSHTLLSNQLTSARADQVNAAIADGGGDRLIVWNDSRFDAPGIYGTFRDTFGPIAETQGFLIGRGRVSGAALRPEIAFGGGVFLVPPPTGSTRRGSTSRPGCSTTRRSRSPWAAAPLG